MEVNVKQALKMLFSKSSFEMIYFEAFANALDAGASEFCINISLSDTKIQNLVLTISDNGVGFDDARFKKFGRLFDVEEQSHKGLGRLVYLCYFENISIESIFEGNKKRTFIFSEDFNRECDIVNVDPSNNGSRFTMSGFYNSKLGKREYIDPSYIKKALLENFYMRFYKAKLAKQSLVVKIHSNIAGIPKEEIIRVEDLPTFEVKILPTQGDLFHKIELYYHIKEVDIRDSNIITAIAVDDRSHRIDVVSRDNFHIGYEMVFLLISESFQGKVDNTRQNILATAAELEDIKVIFRTAISSVINERFPKIKESNNQKLESLNTIYPHLSGYFDTSEIGFSNQQDVLKRAQDLFFRDQKEILGAKELNDEQFEKSLDLSARALAEYILFRQNVIKRMKSLSKSNTEADLHNLIVPRYTEFNASNFTEDVYKNNVWVLDDKFMSYSVVLSESEMKRVIEVMTDGEQKDEDIDRPDITMFFSDDPSDTSKFVDVVVVELKRLGISAENNSIVEFQLDTRTERLAHYYKDRVQRMWFYGVVEFNDKYRMHLINTGYKPLFSHGSVYFRSKKIFLDLEQTQSVIQNSYILDFKALIEDADSRNSTFLKILKSKFDMKNKN